MSSLKLKKIKSTKNARQREIIKTCKNKKPEISRKRRSNNKLINEKCPWLLKMQICPTSFTFFRQQQSTVNQQWSTIATAGQTLSKYWLFSLIKLKCWIINYGCIYKTYVSDVANINFHLSGTCRLINEILISLLFYNILQGSQHSFWKLIRLGHFFTSYKHLLFATKCIFHIFIFI